jgi:uncharacterized protein (TIGR02300 family)
MAIAMSLDPTLLCRQLSVAADLSFGVRGVAKPEWGSKRVCLSCGARFYDMNRTPIVCPACETVFDPAANSKPRRSRAAAKAPVAAAAAAATVVVLARNEVETDDDEIAVADDDAEEETEAESAIEDVSELGDDDMSDVIDTELDEDDSER